MLWPCFLLEYFRFLNPQNTYSTHSSKLYVSRYKMHRLTASYTIVCMYYCTNFLS